MERDADRKVLQVFAQMAAADGPDAHRRLLHKAAKHYRLRQARPRFALVGGYDDDAPDSDGYISVAYSSDSESDSVESGWSG